MSKEITKYPDLILKKECQEVKEITEEIKKLGQEMIEMLIKSQGVGLAAPQIGELKRIIVVQRENAPEVFINPKIIQKSQETIIDEEGCLSIPGIRLKIKRAKKIIVEALNLGGERVIIKADGLPARIFQHEIDHLDGILFINRVDFWQGLKMKLWLLLKN